MKAGYLSSSINTAIEDELDWEFEDVLYLLEEFVKSSNSQDSVWVENHVCALDFSLDKNNSLWVEICASNNNLWAISEIDLTIAKEILKIAFEEKEFSEIIPTTDRTWDAYTPI